MKKKNFNEFRLKKEEEYLLDCIKSARQIQDFLWGDKNDKWNLEEWKRMFRKRLKKIDDISPDNPHAIVELKKRLLQNAALSINLLTRVDLFGIPDKKCDIPSNLKEYSRSNNKNKQARGN